jgi:hypothetical protein
MTIDLFRQYGNLLRFDGTNQSQRTLPALQQGYILPDERSLSDLVEYAQSLASEIRFYNLTGQAVGDWRPFLEPLLDLSTGRARSTADLEAAMKTRRDWPPHMALFLVFLTLFRHLQNDLNELPERHLRHYYEQELSLLRRQAVADAVHVIFELARNAAATLLPAGTLMDAGKDDQGRALSYKTQSELVISAAQLSDIRRLVAETDRRGHRRFFIANTMADTEGKSWYTFGRKQLDLDPSQRFMVEAELGFAIASPLLRMAEGERTLNIIADLHAPGGAYPPAQGISFALSATLTGAEGWLAPDSFDAQLVEHDEKMTLQLTLTLSEAAAAIVPFDSTLHGAGPVSIWPMLRCLLKGETGVYETLDGLTVEQVKLTVTVKGVRDLVVQNADGPLTPDQPMPLFGSQPRIGSPFYIGSAEVFSKKLSSLALHLEWQAPPEDLYDHYQAYFDTTDSDLTDDFRRFFIADLDLLYDRTWDHPLLVRQTLFAPIATDPRRINALESAFRSAFDGRPYNAQPDLDTLAPYDTKSKYGFVRLVLRSPTRDDLRPYASEVPFEAFGHQAFARRYATQAVALSRWTSGPQPKLPNEPYTPTLASLALDYTASVDMIPGNVHGEEALFMLGPFGYTAAGGAVPARLVPEFEGEAALYLGVEKLQPPANLALLFQIDTGTAHAADVLKTGETQWSYLSGGLWKDLPATAVLNDSTYGFQKPGLVVIAVGKEATTDHRTMPSGLVWLRVLIRRPPESAARTIALHTQAALATFTPQTGTLNDYARHLQRGLAAGSIARLQKRNAAVKRVRQPYASFGGRSREPDEDFFRRSSERLRHRNRAVTAWDLERLVLEAFPEVFKVKCLPHSDANGNAQAGATSLVIVPDLRSTESTNPLEPRAGAVLMGQIEEYVTSGLATPFATIHVIHPVYERLRVDIRVAFRSGLDAGYYSGILNEDLRRFLSPWAYEEGEDILFGARIYKSEILAFMEGRDYVDYVINFTLSHSYDGLPRGGIDQMTIGMDFIIRADPLPAIVDMTVGDDFVVGRGVEVAETTRSHAILVSHAEHLITPLSPGEDRCTGVTQLGIGHLTVGLDLKVQPEYVS